MPPLIIKMSGNVQCIWIDLQDHAQCRIDFIDPVHIRLSGLAWSYSAGETNINEVDAGEASMIEAISELFGSRIYQ